MQLIEAFGRIAHVLYDVVIEDDVETVVRKRQVENAVLHQLEFVHTTAACRIPQRLDIDADDGNAEILPDVQRFVGRPATCDQNPRRGLAVQRRTNQV